MQNMVAVNFLRSAEEECWVEVTVKCERKSDIELRIDTAVYLVSRTIVHVLPR
jgi:hypothetical protein